MLYRIFTEDMQRENIDAAVAPHYDGYTFLSGQGVWKGEKENCLVVEIVTDGEADSIIRNIAGKIKMLNRQEAVLVQKVQNENWFV